MVKQSLFHLVLLESLVGIILLLFITNPFNFSENVKNIHINFDLVNKVLLYNSKSNQSTLLILNRDNSLKKNTHMQRVDNFTVLGDRFGNHKNEPFLHIRSIYMDYRKKTPKTWILAIVGKTLNATSAQCHYASKENNTVTKRRAEDIYETKICLFFM